MTAALDQLTDAQKRVLLLRFFGDLTFEEIAQASRLPLGHRLEPLPPRPDCPPQIDDRQNMNADDTNTTPETLRLATSRALPADSALDPEVAAS